MSFIAPDRIFFHASMPRTAKPAWVQHILEELVNSLEEENHREHKIVEKSNLFKSYKDQYIKLSDPNKSK